MLEKFRPEKFKIPEVKKEKEIERKEKIKIPQLLVRNPVKKDAIYQAMTRGYAGGKGDPTRVIYGYCEAKFSEKLEDNIKFILPKFKFESLKNYDKVILEIGCGIPRLKEQATVLDKVLRNRESYPKELVKLCQGVFDGHYLYVGIDEGKYFKYLGIDEGKYLPKLSQMLSKDEIYHRENIVIIGANIFHLLPFIKSNSVDVIVNYSGGDIPVPDRSNVYSDIISASYFRIIKPTGKFFADNIADAPKKLFKWPDEYKHLLYNLRGHWSDRIIKSGVFSPMKKLKMKKLKK